MKNRQPRRIRPRSWTRRNSWDEIFIAVFCAVRTTSKSFCARMRLKRRVTFTCNIIGSSRAIYLNRWRNYQPRPANSRMNASWQQLDNLVRGARPPRDGDSYDVIIVGAGMAGLATAYELRAQKPLVLE